MAFLSCDLSYIGFKLGTLLKIACIVNFQKQTFWKGVFMPVKFSIATFRAIDTIYLFFFFPSCVVGIDFKIKTVELQGKKIKLQIW